MDHRLRCCKEEIDGPNFIQRLLFKGVICAQGFNARQGFPFDEAKAGAAAGGDMVDFLGHAGFDDRRGGVSAADDGEGIAVGQGVSDGKGSQRKGLIFKDA